MEIFGWGKILQEVVQLFSGVLGVVFVVFFYKTSSAWYMFAKPLHW